MKSRYLAVASIFLLASYSHLGPKIAQSIESQTSAGWCAIYYLLVATNAVSIVAWYLFYRPGGYIENSK